MTPKVQPGKVVAVATRVLSLAGLPARTAWALELIKERLHSAPTTRLPLFDADRWHTFDPCSGDRGMPKDLVVLGYGDEPYLSRQGGRFASVRWPVRRNEEAAPPCPPLWNEAAS